MTNCHILRKVIILQSPLIRGEKEKQQLFYFWYTLSNVFFFGMYQEKHILLYCFTKLFYYLYKKNKMIKA
jgi:hypothetical protein